MAESRKPKREKEQKMEANLSQVDTDGEELALLLFECGEEDKQNMMMLNEENKVPEIEAK